MIRRSLSLAAIAMVGSAALSCAPAIPQYEFPYVEQRATLPNGLRLVVLPDDSTNLVEVDVRYDVGANQDPPGKAGLAHLAEHLQFQHRIYGLDKPPIFDVLPQLTTFFNAFTNWDSTHYMLQGRKSDLQTLINLEAARMAAACRAIPAAEFEREREVVRNEIRQRLGTPEGQVPQLILSAVYPEGHPYGQLVGGNDAQLASITQEDGCKFLDTYYVPQNATIVVAGDVDPADVLTKVEYAFGAIDKGLGADGTPREVPRTPVPKIELKRATVQHELDVERTSVYVAWAMPAHTEPDHQYARFLQNALTGAVARFATDWDFASAVYPQELGGARAPVMVLGIDLKPGKSVDEALGFVWKAVANAHRVFEAGAFNGVKAQFKGVSIQQLEPLTSRTVILSDLIQFDDSFDWGSDGEYLITSLETIDKLDGEAARAFVKRTLRKDDAVVVVINAKQGASRGDARASLKFETSTAAGHGAWKPSVDASEAKRPLMVPDTDSPLVQAKRFELGNGMKIVMLPFAKMPIVSMMMVFGAGAAQEPGDLPGVADLAAEFLGPPADSTIGQIGASWDGFADADTTTFTVSGIEIYLAEMIEGLERLITIGEYDQASIERWATSERDRFGSRSVREQQALEREFAMAVWGPTHPYATSGRLTPKSVGKIGRDELQRFHEKHYTAGNATLIISGKFDAARAEAAVREHFGGWGRGRADEPVSQPAAAHDGQTVIAVVAQDLPQVQVRIGYPGPFGTDDQQAARIVLTQMLSQLMGDIRTELGSTYGLGAVRHARLGPSLYVMGGGIDAERAGESLALIRAKLESLRAGENFDLEFARARRVVLQGLLGESTESMTLARRLAVIAIYGLAPDHHDQLTRRVAAATPDQVKAVMQQELVPDNEVLVLFGGREALEKTITAAGITREVKFVDVGE